MSRRWRSTRSARWRWTPCRRPIPAIPARRWRWRRWPTRCGKIPALRSGRSALAQPRPVRAVGRPRLDAALFAAAPGRRAAGRQDGKVTGELAVSLDDIKQLPPARQRDPGHPEYGHTTGVETTTGPLGQGCGNSVGMAIAGAGWPPATTGPASSCSTTTSTRSAATAT